MGNFGSSGSPLVERKSIAPQRAMVPAAAARPIRLGGGINTDPLFWMREVASRKVNRQTYLSMVPEPCRASVNRLAEKASEPVELMAHRWLAKELLFRGCIAHAGLSISDSDSGSVFPPDYYREYSSFLLTQSGSFVFISKAKEKNEGELAGLRAIYYQRITERQDTSIPPELYAVGALEVPRMIDFGPGHPVTVVLESAKDGSGKEAKVRRFRTSPVFLFASSSDASGKEGLAKSMNQTCSGINKTMG